MKKKVIDIQPPKKFKEKLEKKKEKPEFEIEAPGIKYKKPIFLTPTILIVIGVIVIGALCHFTTPHLWGRATIEIWPETEVKTFQTKLTVNKKTVVPDFAAGIIPGKIFAREKTLSEEFYSSGRVVKEKKAEGTIRVYNDYQYSQTLIKNTRFQAPLEKFQSPLDQEKGEYPWFRTLEAITIPAKSFRDVKVVADSSGEKYNITSATFSIPGLAGTPQYTLVYGKSFDSMKGGFKQELPSVTEEDLQKAKDALTEKAKKETEGLLRSDISSEFVFLEGALETKIVEAFSLAKAGAEVERFNYQVKAQSQTLLFKKEDVEIFAQNFITPQISENKKLYKPALKINYSPEAIDLDAGRIILNLEMEVKIYSQINEIPLKKGLAGKSLAEAQISLENQPLITMAQVKFWPFWVKRFPKDPEKIEVKLNID